MSSGGREPGRPRTISVAGDLAYVYGLFGVLTGLAAALTFIPYRYASTYGAGYAELFTVLAGLGVIASAMGMAAAWGLFRARPWAWNLALGVAASCIALNAIMAGFWPGYVAFLGVVALAYGIEIVLLLMARRGYQESIAGRGRGPFPTRAVPAPGAHL